MTTSASLSNDTQFGQYRIVRLLGRGGMGEVYEVEHRVLARTYALKLLPQDFATRSEAVHRFELEAKVMANLEHPHIVRVDEFGQTEGRYWLRMQLVHGVEERSVDVERGHFCPQVGARDGGGQKCPRSGGSLLKPHAVGYAFGSPQSETERGHFCPQVGARDDGGQKCPRSGWHAWLY